MGLIGVSSVKIIKGSKSPLEIHKLKAQSFIAMGIIWVKMVSAIFKYHPPFLTLFWIIVIILLFETIQKIKEFGKINYIITGPCATLLESLTILNHKI